MVKATRAKMAWLLLLPQLILWHAVAGCEGSCDEEAICSQAKFSNCSYDGCGQLTCLAILIQGHVICNEDGTEGCSAWPQIDEGCATVFSAAEDQAGCTELLMAVIRESSGSNGAACREAVLGAAPCVLGDDGALCDFAPIDAACLIDPPQCE